MLASAEISFSSNSCYEELTRDIGTPRKRASKKVVKFEGVTLEPVIVAKVPRVKRAFKVK